ncbi:hypothetical protein HZS_5158 [Henneguya salminicola]|nr:hypothetical protein HZS_5158 [Henneguya salminicola]
MMVIMDVKRNKKISRLSYIQNLLFLISPCISMIYQLKNFLEVSKIYITTIKKRSCLDKQKITDECSMI